MFQKFPFEILEWKLSCPKHNKKEKRKNEIKRVKKRRSGKKYQKRQIPKNKNENKQNKNMNQC